jgi:hypothetical protein
MGAKGGGTFYFNKTGNIYIDPNMVQGSKQFGELTYAQLATVIGHELTHALLSVIDQSPSSAANPRSGAPKTSSSSAVIASTVASRCSLVRLSFG